MQTFEYTFPTHYLIYGCTYIYIYTNANSTVIDANHFGNADRNSYIAYIRETILYSSTKAHKKPAGSL